jgi:hypothetical protein
METFKQLLQDNFMITEMKVGKYYRIPGGLKKRPISFNNKGYMDFMLDGKWHKCIEERKFKGLFSDRFKFEGCEFEPVFKEFWNWTSIYEILEERQNIDEDGQYLLDI